MKVCSETGNAVIWMSEENYMFRLSAYAEPLLGWLDSNPNAIVPKSRAAEVRALIAAGLPDLSVSRSAAKLDWGIPVPTDPSHTVYVWLDALANYLTVAGYPDNPHPQPPDVQVVGKDILKFHAIYWPAFLMAAGLGLPSTIVAHAHWTLDGKKIAKSRGNTIDPFAKLDEYGADQLRFFLLREGRIQDDADFTEARVVACVDELANKLGNLFSRSTGRKINPSGTVPAVDAVDCTGDLELELIAQLERTMEQVPVLYNQVQLSEGIDEVMGLLRAVNVYFDLLKPWELAQQPDNPEAQLRLQTVLYMTLESLRISAILLQPIVPTLAGELLDRLQMGEGKGERDINALRFGYLDGQTLSTDQSPLVAKIVRQ
jgi:methionyl-tRNA synthetase